MPESHLEVLLEPALIAEVPTSWIPALVHGEIVKLKTKEILSASLLLYHYNNTAMKALP